ncbi:hypothetical protein DMN91_009905 [Ooceraea biroi]|uniref:Peroxisomal targeting signal 1 receptor n=1 Tax=Ooceraea biroi TaxID=2015173 RepID=A0A026W2Y4_OOCBI|nr:peroxisomal targeting signal 1 receptor [Ooceraea biroi]XP_011344979.1 peroxisomal targeting signal 1 receptor [Ooceraea biroi]EZA50440.1 Peroxisomal targeting signal 1 receptor [Ooceraea biroi]RLU17669.1 hypothetical protein DMN91_009905 [Ooceraea biroi]
MAFHGLVEGDCGGPSSLIHLASHYVRDHGFKEEGIHRPFDSQNERQTPDTDQLVQQFLQEPACPQTFRMDSLLQEMREIDKTIRPPITAPRVANELADLDAAWSNACFKPTESLHEFRANDRTWSLPVIQSEASLHFPPHETHELGLDPKWAEEYVEQRIDANDDKSNVRHENPARSKLMKFMQQETDAPIESDQKATACSDSTVDEWIEHFFMDKPKTDDGVTDNASDHAVLNKMEEQLTVAGSWMDEFVNPALENSLDDVYESTWERLNEMNTAQSDYNATFNKEYEFCKTNPMKDLPNALAEGKRRLEAEDLPSAVLCFEAAVQQDENNVEAWLLLGKTQAENEQDPLAISALNRCLSLDPSNSVALMTLAASYANESFQKQACLTLKEWLLKNEKYNHLSVSEAALKNSEQLPLGMSTLLFDQVYNEVKDLYIQAARMNPRDGIDADVQCGLGILFNLYSEYDKAADCFRAALQVRPDDSRLWNKLGATLANGQRSAEAINMYHRALELSPGFIRARYNLGVSCVTLGAYKEAGEHLLTVLNQQAAGMGPQGSEASHGAMSNSIWTTLRFVVLFMNRYELMNDVENRDLSRLNKEFEVA